ncbi:hypothetical protein [Parvicella tangerina]|uniref:Uncharacterized protein n=1 Tax=Parvicella tangerina TaxID=2829795 RepID=A0A916JQ65_9FLAO|nr:hypothetical protein [Parvicella tangerina]CAG5085988.1 hypothetical protein CRYO30217_02964 [Parvicella tangerina]
MKLLILTIYVLISISSFSQHDHSGHNHDNDLYNLVNHPPHNGVVEKAGKYYIEVVTNWMQKSNNTTIYLMNYAGKIVTKKKVSCKVSIINNEKKVEVITNKIDDESYRVHLDSNDPLKVEVIFFVKNKKYSAFFFTRGNGE